MNEKKLTDSEKIKCILSQFNLKKSEFSTKSGISTQQVFDLIRGQISNLSRENMEKILKTYPEISPYWLITGEGQMIVGDNNISINQGDNNRNNINANFDKLIELSSSQQQTISEQHQTIAQLVNMLNNK